MPSFRSSVQQLALALCSLGAAVSQIYNFHNVTAPDNYSLTTASVFYVYAADDVTGSTGPPSIRFEHLEIHCNVHIYRDGECPGYDSVQVTLMPYTEFWTYIHPDHFCCKYEEHVTLGCRTYNLLLHNGSRIWPSGKRAYTREAYPSDVYSYTILGSPMETRSERIIDRTGQYLLVVSNCGYEDSVMLSGSVIVRNSYGYLPGSEYPRIALNGWLAVAYAALTCIWTILMVVFSEDLFKIPACPASVIVTTMARSICWWAFFCDWNTSGVRSDKLLQGVVLLEGLCASLSTFLFLSASLGWGITLPVLRWKLLAKLVPVTALYGVSASAILYDFEIKPNSKDLVHLQSSASLFALACVQVALSFGIFCVVCRVLTQQMRALSDPRQTAKLWLFVRVRRILCITVLFFVATGILQVVDLARNNHESWQTEWIWKDGLPRVLEVFINILMMWLWAPYSYRKHYEPEHQEMQTFLNDEAQWSETEPTDVTSRSSPLVL